MAPNRQAPMTIGQAAEAAGVAATTLRYYEREGILEASYRTSSGYRLYDEEALERLLFIKSSQAIGFTLGDIRTLLDLNGEAVCAEVQELISKRLGEVDAKLADLKRVRKTLAEGLERCRQSTGDCAVMADLKKDRKKS